MRMLKILSLNVILLAALASVLEAQTWDGRGYAAVSGGLQMQGRSFTETSTPDFYGERGSISIPHEIRSGGLVDVEAGMRVWRAVAIGVGFSRFRDKDAPTVTARVPHPLIFGQPRQATSSAGTLKHSENVVHLHLLYMYSVTDKVQVAFFLGPSIFTVRQDFASVQASDVSDPAPFNNVSLTNVRVTSGTESAVGANIGLDGTYLIRSRIGVGAFMRYTGASVEIETPASGPLNLDAGGFQAGIGLRARF